jgi:hypothetical protein
VIGLTARLQRIGIDANSSSRSKWEGAAELHQSSAAAVTSRAVQAATPKPSADCSWPTREKCSSPSAEIHFSTQPCPLPTMYQAREFAAAGGLISYGSSFAELYRLTGGMPVGS